MFLQLKIQDKVQIHPAVDDKEECIRDTLSVKYCNNYIENNTLVVTITDIEDVESYEITNGFLIANVIFNAISFKFFVGEIIEGKICQQEEDFILVSLPFFDNIIIESTNFPGGCDKTCVMPKGGTRKCIIWYWIYNDAKYYFRNNETVRFRVFKIEDMPLKIYGSFMETGLGPKEWWI